MLHRVVASPLLRPVFVTRFVFSQRRSSSAVVVRLCGAAVRLSLVSGIGTILAMYGVGIAVGACWRRGDAASSSHGHWPSDRSRASVAAVGRVDDPPSGVPPARPRLLLLGRADPGGDQHRDIGGIRRSRRWPSDAYLPPSYRAMARGRSGAG